MRLQQTYFDYLRLKVLYKTKYDELVYSDDYGTIKNKIFKEIDELMDSIELQKFDWKLLDKFMFEIKLLNIDCNESEGLANHFGIIQVPTMMIYKDKETMILNKEGIMLASDIAQLIGLKD